MMEISPVGGSYTALFQSSASYGHLLNKDVSEDLAAIIITARIPSWMRKCKGKVAKISTDLPKNLSISDLSEFSSELVTGSLISWMHVGFLPAPLNQGISKPIFHRAKLYSKWSNTKSPYSKAWTMFTRDLISDSQPLTALYVCGWCWMYVASMTINNCFRSTVSRVLNT